MIKAIVHRYQAVFVLAVMITLMGFSAYMALPRESAPEIRRPLIFVTTIYPGVGPKEVENLITDRIESEIDGVKGLDKLKSTSFEGMSLITAEFEGDIDVELALRRIKEKVDIAKAELPSDVEEPVVKELNFSDQPVLIITISHDDGLQKLEHYVDYLEDSIEDVQGVQEVMVSGKLKKELEIAVDASKLKHYNLSINDVKNAIRDEHISIPGGTLKTSGMNYSLSVSGEFTDPEEFKNIIIKNKVQRVLLGQIADVNFHYAEPESFARLNGVPAVSLAVKKRAGANMLVMVDDIMQVLKDSEHKKPQGTSITYPFDESLNIKRMVTDLENNILSALLLVLLVTLFFLGAINATFVSLAIPFSMLLSFFVISMFGMTLNMVVLFSLVIALGMLVDNGIVIVENIYRHAGMGKSRVDAAIDGTREIAFPIITSTATTILAFFPIIFMPGIMGEFMSFLPKTVIIVLSSSLFIGLTLTTVFCSRFLRADQNALKSMSEGDKGFKRIQNIYLYLLTKVLNKPKSSVFVMFIAVIGGIMAYGKLGREALFFPELDPLVANVKVKLPSGSPLDNTDAFTKPLEQIVQNAKGSIDSVQTTIGSASSQGGARDSFRSEIRINYMPYLERKIPSSESIEYIREKVKNIPGAEIKVDKMAEGPPKGNDISYEIHGQDYQTMGDLAQKALQLIYKHSDVLENINSDYEAAKPEYKIAIDREKARRLGFSTRTIASTIRSTLSGSKEAIFKQGTEEYDIMLRFKNNYRSELSHLLNLEIVHEGKKVPLRALATITKDQGVAEIKRRERVRSISVFADFKPDVPGREKVKKEISEGIKALKIPRGYEITTGEGQAIRDRSTRFLANAFLVALFLIFLVMVIQFNSVTQPLIILTSVFLSLGGVFWGLLFANQQFVIIMSGIGVISLAGVVVNNAIVLIDFINQLKNQGKEMKEAILEASVTRLRPVLLTAITTVIGLLPMALGISFDFFTFHLQIGSESSEWWAPMAWTIIFGLTFATVLTLFIVPSLMLIDHRIGSYFKTVLGSKNP